MSQLHEYKCVLTEQQHTNLLATIYIRLHDNRDRTYIRRVATSRVSDPRTHLNVHTLIQYECNTPLRFSLGFFF